MLNLLIDDGCCGDEFFKFQERGHAVIDKWECPACGCEWNPIEVGGVVHLVCGEKIWVWR